MSETNRPGLAKYARWLTLAGGAIQLFTGLAALLTFNKWAGNSLDADWVTAYIWFMGLVLTVTGPFALWSARVVAANSWLANRLQLWAGLIGLLVAYQVHPFYWVLIGPVLIVISSVLSGRIFHHQVAVVMAEIKGGAWIYHDWYTSGQAKLVDPGEENGVQLDPTIFKYLRAGKWLIKRPASADNSGVDYYQASGKKYGKF